MKGYWGKLAISLALLALLYAGLTSYTKNADIANLPYYAVNTLARLTVAYFISLAFGLAAGVAMGLNDKISKIFLPVFDILQTIPVLGYFPAAVVLLISFFNGSVFGVEVAAQLLLFTSMSWSILFAVYSAVRTIPADVIDAAKEFGISGFDYIRHVVLPYTIPSLVTSSSLAWGGGWFFIIVAEFISYGGHLYPLNGLGYVIAKAAFVDNNIIVALAALAFMSAIVLITNHFVFYRFIRKSGDYTPIFKFNLKAPSMARGKIHRVSRQQSRNVSAILRYRFNVSLYARIILLLAVLAFVFAFVIPSLPSLVRMGNIPSLADVSLIPSYTLFTLGRIFIAYFISLAVGTALGIAAAENETVHRIMDPVYTIGYSVPALAVFPMLIVVMTQLLPGEIGLETTSIITLFITMVWYIFMNVLGAVKGIPKTIGELSRLYNLRGWKRLLNVTIPAVIPAIVTGSMLAIAGGWNVIIFSEYVVINNREYKMPGLGYLIDKAADRGDTIFLLLLIGIISLTVILLENFVWKRLLEKSRKYKLEED